MTMQRPDSLMRPLCSPLRAPTLHLAPRLAVHQRVRQPSRGVAAAAVEAPGTKTDAKAEAKAAAKAQAKAAKRESRQQAKAAGKQPPAGTFGDTSANKASSDDDSAAASAGSSAASASAPATSAADAGASPTSPSSPSTAAAADPSAASTSPAVEVAPDADSDRRQKGTSGISSGIRLENISMTFKNQQVLKNCTWEVKKGERVGLVGVNGAGKTTQLQIIMGRLLPDAGEVVKAKRNMKIAYLAQEFDVVPTRTVREQFYSVYQEQLQVIARQDEIAVEMESCGEDMDRMQQLIEELAKVQGKALSMDVKLLDKKIDQMMPELGFAPEDNDRLVASYSGGWQMRMCLGKILLQEPDLLLLDEPTNHLDLDAIQWLEQYLKKQEVPMVVVSHDREFLDQLCTRIVETERGVASSYPGNYTQYVTAKSEREALQWQAWEKQQKEVSRLEDLISRLSGGAQSGRASAAKITLERMKAEGLVEKPFVPKQRSFTFPPVEKMGQKVVTIEGLTHGYNGRPLFRDADLVIERGDRVAIIGPNGAGKSTLLRLIMGREQPVEGRVEMGEHNIVPNYFEQNQAEALDPELSVMDTLVQSAPDAKANDLKALLGRMLFSGLAMEKKVKVLSGGEKARLALAKFMCTQGTLLVLDEPTNHLDIPSKETLETAIKAFQGSVIAVSHDRYFLKQIATRVLLVEDCQLMDFEGDYEYYLSQNEEEAVKMEAKEEKLREIEKDNIKAKSKMTRAEKGMMKKAKAKEFNAKHAK